VLQWTTRRASPALILELGRHEGGVGAVAALPDGRAVTGGGLGVGLALVWDPAEPGTSPVELGPHGVGVTAVAVLPAGRVVTGDYDDRVRLRNVQQSSSPGTLLACSARASATSFSSSGARLFIGHSTSGISCWEVRPATQNTPEVQQRGGNADATTDMSVPKVQVKRRAGPRPAFSSQIGPIVRTSAEVAL
jgi:WD40 repeat protein